MHGRDILVVVDEDVVNLSGGVRQDRIVDVAHLLYMLPDKADAVVPLKRVAPVVTTELANLLFRKSRI
jgi:hypothetical protein